MTVTLPHLRHVRLREPVDGREHLLLVYGDRDQLICWCGPYETAEAYRRSQQWGSGGWGWPGGTCPAALQPVKERRDRSRQGVVVRLGRAAAATAARVQADALVA